MNRKPVMYDESRGGFCTWNEKESTRDLEVPVDTYLLGVTPPYYAFIIADLVVGNITPQQAISQLTNEIYLKPKENK